MALSANALTTVTDELRSDLGITGNAEDEKIRRVINAASDLIESHANRIFYRDDAIVEKVASRGTRELLLSRMPVHSIASIVYGGETVDAGSYEIGDSDAGLVTYLGNEWPWRPLASPDVTLSPLPGTARKLYAVTYSAGFYTQRQADQKDPAAAENNRTLPYDIEEACNEMVRAILLGKGRDPSIVSEKLMSWAATYAKPGSGSNQSIPSSVKDAMKPYTRSDW